MVFLALRERTGKSVVGCQTEGKWALRIQGKNDNAMADSFEEIHINGGL
jgi:hypothetical protein